MRIIERTDGRYRGHKEGYTCLIQFKHYDFLLSGSMNDNDKFWSIHTWLQATYGPTILTQPEFKRNPMWGTDWGSSRRSERRIYLKDSSCLLLVRLAVPEVFDKRPS